MMNDELCVVHPRAAGLDVHKGHITATVRLADPTAPKPRAETRMFNALPSGLAALVAWSGTGWSRKSRPFTTSPRPAADPGFRVVRRTGAGAAGLQSASAAWRAHAIVAPGHGHDAVWQAAVRRTGCTAKLQHRHAQPEAVDR